MSSIPESSSVNHLIALRSHFERQATEAEAKAATLREQIEHVNALLLHQLAPAHGIDVFETLDEPTTTELFLSAQADTPTEQDELALDFDTPQSLSQTTETPEPITEKAPEPSSSKGGRSKPRAMQPPYQALTRLEAIAQVLQAQPGQAINSVTITQELFGPLSQTELKAEEKRLKTLLYKGEKNQLWQKGKAPSSFLIKVSKGKAQSNQKKSPATPDTAAVATDGTAAKPRTQRKAPAAKPTASTNGALTLQPPYQDMAKSEAIVAVLEQQSGKAVHRDAIIQFLYGDLSSEDLKAERKRMTTTLHRGIKTKKWQKASAPSTVRLDSTAKKAPSNRSGGKSKGRAPKTEAAQPSKDAKAGTSKAKTSARTKAKTPRRKATRSKAKAKG